MGLLPGRGAAVGTSFLGPWRRGPGGAVQDGDLAVSLPNLKLQEATSHCVSPGCSKIGQEWAYQIGQKCKMRAWATLKSHCLPCKIPIYEDNYLRAGTLPDALLGPLLVLFRPVGA